MPSLLSMGGGASEGLDTYLQRMIEQAKLEALAKSQGEIQRHNMASEDILTKQHELQAKTADEARREREQAHTDIRNDRAQDNGRALGDEIPADTFLPTGDPAIRQMTEGGVGSLLRMKSSLPSTSTAGGMTMPGGDEAVTGTSASKVETPAEIGRIKLKSYKQQHEDQVASKPGGDYNVEEKTVLYKGKPTPVLFDPRAPNKAGAKGKYTFPATGEDISDQVQHYEKPPQEDRVLIQTGDGYIRRPDAAKKLTDGGEVPLPTTGSTRTMEEGARMLQPHIKRLEQTANDLDRAGLFGPVMSRVRTLLTKAGTLGDFEKAVSNDPELNKDRVAGQFATSLGLLATGAGRVHGGARGGGSPQMYEHFKSMLSDAGSLNMFLGRLDSLDEYMGGYAAGPGEKEPPKTSDPYEEYLKRKKP